MRKYQKLNKKQNNYFKTNLHLSAGEVKDFFAEQLEDDHVVLAEALVRLARSNDVRNERLPIFGPLSLQDLEETELFELLTTDKGKTKLPLNDWKSKKMTLIDCISTPSGYHNILNLLLYKKISA